MKKFLSLMLGAAMLFALAACNGGTSSNAPASTPEASTPAEGGSEPATSLDVDEIYIGGIAPLTGGVSQYGIAVTNGAKLAVEEINAAGGILGVQIRYDVLDDTGEATEAVSAYEKLYNDGVVAILGAVTSGPSIAMAQVAAGDNMPVISASATADDFTKQGENVFRACFTDPYQGRLMANYAQERLDAQTVAVLFDQDDDYSSGIAEAFREEAAALNLEVVASEGFNNGADDFNAQLTRIREANPDVVLVPTYYEEAAKILIQANSLGIDATFIGADGWNGVHNQIGEGNTGLLEGTFYCSQYSPQSEAPEVQAFLSNYLETYGIEENMFAVLGYDSMYILADAIERAGSLDSQDIIDALNATSFRGLTGTTSFDAERGPVRTSYITTFEEGVPTVTEEYDF